MELQDLVAGLRGECGVDRARAASSPQNWLRVCSTPCSFSTCVISWPITMAISSSLSFSFVMIAL